VSLKDVEAAARQVLSTKPKIVSLAPNSLKDLIQGIQEIADALDAPEAGETLIAKMNHRMDAVKESVQQAKGKPSVVCVEWIDPLMAAGNWVPELVDMAGGIDLLGIPKEHTPRLPIEELVKADPDIIISMPCGWDIAKTRQEMAPALQTEAWQSLRAVKNGQLYLTDGNQYFNRPGPRVVDSLEILAEILHPDLCSYGYEGKGWERY
jgi:iron complex transport system substrate-binding protein